HLQGFLSRERSFCGLSKNSPYFSATNSFRILLPRKICNLQLPLDHGIMWVSWFLRDYSRGFFSSQSPFIAKIKSNRRTIAKIALSMRGKPPFYRFSATEVTSMMDFAIRVFPFRACNYSFSSGV
ncbi:MAG: hypothetical protein J6O18_11140, partial [Bacilli bacterium]|nr:hypothetical protein [Bacilli bacterium]